MVLFVGSNGVVFTPSEVSDVRLNGNHSEQLLDQEGLEAVLTEGDDRGWSWETKDIDHLDD